jgi:hypothetical protein
MLSGLKIHAQLIDLRLLKPPVSAPESDHLKRRKRTLKVDVH